MKRLLLAALALVSLSACTPLLPTFAAQQAIPWDINAFRAARGRAALSWSPGLQPKADSVAAWMAGGGCGHASNGVPNICHSNLAAGVSVPWTVIEENVGMICPPDPAALERAFERSPEHEANILGPVTAYAVGVAEASGCLYVAEEFLA